MPRQIILCLPDGGQHIAHKKLMMLLRKNMEYNLTHIFILYRIMSINQYNPLVVIQGLCQLLIKFNGGRNSSKHMLRIIEHAFAFEPVLNASLKSILQGKGGSVQKKKQILIYGRPSTDRNAFSLIVAALNKWVKNYLSTIR